MDAHGQKPDQPGFCLRQPGSELSEEDAQKIACLFEDNKHTNQNFLADRFKNSAYWTVLDVNASGAV